ncbi:hypothetical protein LXL04_010089 [Taraxacum kok-saghyz]
MGSYNHSYQIRGTVRGTRYVVVSDSIEQIKEFKESRLGFEASAPKAKSKSEPSKSRSDNADSRLGTLQSRIRYAIKIDWIRDWDRLQKSAIGYRAIENVDRGCLGESASFFDVALRVFGYRIRLVSKLTFSKKEVAEIEPGSAAHTVLTNTTSTRHKFMSSSLKV